MANLRRRMTVEGRQQTTSKELRILSEYASTGSGALTSLIEDEALLVGKDDAYLAGLSNDNRKDYEDKRNALQQRINGLQKLYRGLSNQERKAFDQSLLERHRSLGKTIGEDLRGGTTDERKSFGTVEFLIKIFNIQ